MRLIADINVLFPLLVSQHPARKAALTWWQQQADASVGLCAHTQLGTLRLLTNSIVMNGHPANPEAALGAWTILAEDPRCVELPPPPAGQSQRLMRLVLNRNPSSSLWTDAWLAAWAEGLGLDLVSFDKKFAQFNLPNYVGLSID